MVNFLSGPGGGLPVEEHHRAEQVNAGGQLGERLQKGSVEKSTENGWGKNQINKVTKAKKFVLNC